MDVPTLELLVSGGGDGAGDKERRLEPGVPERRDRSPSTRSASTSSARAASIPPFCV